MFAERNVLSDWRERPHGRKGPFLFLRGVVGFFRLAVFFLFLFQSGFAAAQVDDGDWLPSVSFPKSSFDLGAEYESFSSDPPNILLFLDTSGRMLWTNQGKPPGKYPYDPYLDLDLDHCTFGDGSRPWRYDGRDQERWGRDLDPENNLTPEIALDETRRNAFIEENYHPNLLWRNKHNTPPQGYPSHFSDADLAPNDSRMYKAKMILTKILSDPSLVRETNIAFATYKQKRITAWSDFYLKSPYRLGSWITNPFPPFIRNDSEYVRWGVLHTDQRNDSEAYRRAMLRSGFLAVGKNDDPSVKLAPILALIDGIEETGDDEIKADGACPLAGSIAGKAYTERDRDSNNLPTGTVEQFFKRKAPISSRCQANWLVLFVYGQDTSRNGDPVAAVEALSRDTAVLGTYVMEKGVRTMVVGFLDPEAQPELATTLDAMAKKGNPEVSNAHAYLSDNVVELLKAFRIIFRSIKDVSGANSAPVVRPPLKGEREGHYFVAANTTKQNDQWEGHLYRHALSIDISGNVVVGAVPLWDAGERLALRRSDTRKVYTVDWDFSQSNAALGTLQGSNMVAFSTENASALRDEMGLSSAQALQFISWVRGVDVWNPDFGNGERWKLADMFGSDIVVVGPPRGTYSDRHYKTFAAAHKDRKPQVYVQSNGGLLHAFDFETGEETWAFIPPNVLRFNRLVGLVSDDLYGWPSGTGANRSISRFLLDGPLVVEDMKIGGQYRTVLFGSLGRGGYGVYALDITEAESPRFLWAMEYNGYASRTPPFSASMINKATRYVSLWHGKSGPGETGSDYQRIDLDRITAQNLPPVDLSLTPEERGFDYRDLRFPVGAPVLGSVQCDASWKNRDGGICWIGLLAGGAASTSDTSDASGAVYVMDMTDGGIAGVPMRTEGMAYSPPSAYTFRNDNVLEGFFLGTSQGVIHRGIFDGSLPEATTLEKVFVLELPGKDGVLRRVGIPLALEVTLRNDEEMWLFGGTRDVPTASGTLDNDGQCFFAINTGSGSSLPIRTTDLTALDPDATAFSSNRTGWYVPLFRSAATEEYVTDRPRIAGGVLFVSTFTPDPTISASSCSVTGSSRVYIVDAFSGKGLWDAAGKKSVRLDGVKVTGVRVTSTQTAEGEKHQVYLGVTNLEKKPFSDPALQGLNLQENPGVLVFDVPEEARKVMDANRRYVPGVPVIQYWRDVFNR